MNQLPRVVVAGPSADAREYIATILRDEPVHIVDAADGQKVIELARANSADLVLMDSRMPGIDGLEVTRAIRRTIENRLLPIVLISGHDDVANRVAALDAGADDFLTRPLEPSEVLARLRSLLRLKSIYDRREDARQVIFSLAKAAEAKDLFTLEHAERVADNSADLGRRIRLASDVVAQIRFGALIHDIGKLAVPDRVLNKPGPLTPEEFELVKTHPVVGAEIVTPLAAQRHLSAIVRNHHERYDGNGYPDRLAAEAIPLAARIVAVCDAFDAMTNQRPYRVAMPHSEALANLKAGRDTQWDRQLVDEFIAMQQQR